MAVNLHPSFTEHPGVWLKRCFFEPEGISVYDVARKLDTGEDEISPVLSGEVPMSRSLAQLLESAYGLNADSLMRMQTKFYAAKGQGKI